MCDPRDQEIHIDGDPGAEPGKPGTGEFLDTAEQGGMESEAANHTPPGRNGEQQADDSNLPNVYRDFDYGHRTDLYKYRYVTISK